MNSRARRPLALFLTTILCLTLAGGILGTSGQRTLADSAAELGPAPVYTGQELPPPEYAAAATGPSVNTSSRAASAALYNDYYLGPGSPAINWTGDFADCLPGGTSTAFKSAVLKRIQYFRAMAGVPAAVTTSTTLNDKDRKAALMMGATGALDHTPDPDDPNDPDWKCFTDDGAEAAGKSNLALGKNGWEAIRLYMWDFGDTNEEVGHRRWLLYPQTTTFGNGDVADTDGGGPFRSANALWVWNNLGDPRPPTRDDFVAWPPKGYVPYQVVYPRWSFSYPGADFSDATVSVTSFGVSIPLNEEPLNTAFIGEPTLVWIFDGLEPEDGPSAVARDTRYQVTVDDVIVNGQSRTFNYDVVIFDPATPPPTPPSCTLVPSSGRAGTTITFNCINFEPGEPVDLYWGISAGTIRGTFTADDDGAGSGSFRSLESTAGPHLVSAKGRISRTVAKANFTTTPAITLNPTTAPKGATVKVKIIGFEAGESITLTWHDYLGNPVKTLKTGIIASSLGSAMATFVVPSSGSGQRKVGATGNGGSTASAMLTLVPAAAAASVPEPTATPTTTPRPTRTPRPTSVPTSTPEPAPTDTPSPTATETPTPEPTATETPTPEPTATDTPEPTPTATATVEPEPVAPDTEGETGA